LLKTESESFMTDQRRFGGGDVILFLVILAAAAGTRVWYLSAFAGNAQNPGPLQVQGAERVLKAPRVNGEADDRAQPTELHVLVRNLKEQRQFACQAPLAPGEEITAHRAPGYAFLLAGLELSPLDPAKIDQTVRWLQCGLGTLTVVFYFFFALRAFRSRLVAALTGLLGAFYPFWIVNTAEINDGVLATFLLAACLLLGVKAAQTGGAFSSLLYGLLLAGLALVRAALLPFALVALVWFLYRCRTVRRGWLCALLAFLGFTNGLGSWTFRNAKAFGDIIPITDSVYLHLWMGNNAQADGGPQTEQALLETLAVARGEDPKTTAEALGQLKQNERYNALAGDVRKQIQRDPEGTLRRRFEATGCFFLGHDWPRRPVAESSDMPDWLAGSYRTIFYGSLLALLVLGVLGWRWTYGWRHESMPSSLALIWIPLPYILSHAEVLHGPRLPLDGVLLCYAAFALVCLIPRVGTSLFEGPESEKGASHRSVV
jgi:hypothetical protein